MSEGHGKYDQPLPHHDPSEGFDGTEPDSKSITGFVIASVITLVVVILALQFYFNGVWNAMVSERVLSVPGGELATQRQLEEWRFTHYEYTDKSKSTVRIPLDRARQLYLEDAKAGKTFYPAKPTEPKPETPADAPKEVAKGEAKK
jgi:hypothetical protein